MNIDLLYDVLLLMFSQNPYLYIYIEIYTPSPIISILSKLCPPNVYINNNTFHPYVHVPYFITCKSLNFQNRIVCIRQEWRGPWGDLLPSTPSHLVDIGLTQPLLTAADWGRGQDTGYIQYVEDIQAPYSKSCPFGNCQVLLLRCSLFFGITNGVAAMICTRQHRGDPVYCLL